MTDRDAACGSDEDLLRAHVEGDPEAFAELVRRHKDRLWAVALRTCRDPEDAADALQDALLSAFRRAETFRGDARVSTWLHRIVVNACLDRLRSRKARATVPLTGQDSEVSLPAMRDAIADHDLHMSIRDALARLSPDQRAAIVLVDLEGWPVDQAARILDCPPGTVKSRCHRGRMRLAELLTNGNLSTRDPVPTNDPGKSGAPEGST